MLLKRTNHFHVNISGGVLELDKKYIYNHIVPFRTYSFVQYKITYYRALLLLTENKLYFTPISYFHYTVYVVGMYYSNSYTYIFIYKIILKARVVDAHRKRVT